METRRICNGGRRVNLSGGVSCRFARSRVPTGAGHIRRGTAAGAEFVQGDPEPVQDPGPGVRTFEAGGEWKLARSSLGPLSVLPGGHRRLAESVVEGPRRCAWRLAILVVAVNLFDGAPN